MSETHQAPEPSEVRREFTEKHGRKVRAVVLRDGRVGVVCGADLHYASAVALEDAPEFARCVLEVHEEATSPDPPKCPFCGVEAKLWEWPSKAGWVGWCPVNPTHPHGPTAATPAEALAAFAGLKKQGAAREYVYKDAGRYWWKLTVERSYGRESADDPGTVDYYWSYVLYREDGGKYEKVFGESVLGQGDHEPGLAEFLEDLACRMTRLAIGFAQWGKDTGTDNFDRREG